MSNINNDNMKCTERLCGEQSQFSVSMFRVCLCVCVCVCVCERARARVLKGNAGFCNYGYFIFFKIVTDCEYFKN